MNIKNINTRFKTSIIISLVYDDDSESSYTLEEGSSATITYLKDGKIYTETGVIKKLEYIEPAATSILFPISETNQVVRIYLDCSKEYDSKISTIYSCNIRGINDTSYNYAKSEPTVSGNTVSSYENELVGAIKVESNPSSI